jgi:ribosomal protein S18 acetylase RimI-like enzyme
VDPGRQNQGIGKALVLESFVISATNNLKTIEVVTQLENTGACAFYSKSGFEISNVQNIYHFWLQ